MTDNIIKVLLLEDNPTDVLLLQAALESDLLNTFSLTTVEKLSQGLSLLDQESFDLILLDLSLPDSHGFETFEQLHQRDSSLPIIIWSGNTDEQAAILAVQAGAQDYIVKDAASLAILARSIRYAVERQQIQLKLRAREKYWRTLIEQSVDAITLVAVDGAILYKSPAAMPILGYTMEELEGRNAFEFVFPEDRAVAAQSFIQSMNQPHQPVFSQVRFIRKDGTLCWVEATTTNWLDDPALGAVVINYRDITQRKQMEEALRQSEQQMSSLVTSLDDIVFEIDEQGRYLNVWAADESLLAQPKAQILGRRIEEVLGEEKGRFFTEIVQRVLTRGNPESVEYCLEIGGEQRWFVARTSPILAQDDSYRTASLLVQDITARKQTEELVQAQRDLARITSMITSAEAAWPLCLEVALRVSGMDSGGIYLFDPAGQVLHLIYQQGLSADFVQKVSRYPVDTPNVQLILSGQSSYFAAIEISHMEYTQREGLKSIGVIPIQHQKRVLGCINIASHTVLEISGFARQALEMIAAEIGNIVVSLYTASLLRESEEKYRSLIDSQDAAISTIDAKGVIHYMNQIGAAPLAGSPEDVVGRNLQDFFPPPVVEQQLSWIGQVIATGQGLVTEYQTTLAGQSSWHQVSIQPVRNAAGQVVLAMVNSVDITERKQAEEKLQRMEKHYRALIEHAPDGIVLITGDGKFKYVSPSAEKLFDYLPGEILNLDPAELTHPADRSSVVAALANLLQDSSQVPTLQYRFLHRNGNWRWIESTFSNLLAVPSVEAIVINFHDITEQKQAAEALRESEERFRTLYETMTQGIVYQDTEGKIISVNPAAERVLGLTLDQMQGLTSIDPRWRAIHEDGTDFPGEAHPVMVALHTGQPVNNVVMGVFHPQAEQYVWININATPQFKPGQTKPYQVYATFENITARKLNEDLMRARLRLIEFASTHTVKELLQATLDEVGALISSPIGFFHVVDADQSNLTLQAWSTRTSNEFCTTSGEDSHYSIDLAGVWADCAREARPIIHNNYAQLENRRGMPVGHAEVTREAVVPIMRGDRIVAIIGIGNKPNDYTPADLEVISALADMSWDIIERKGAEEALRESEARAQAMLKAIPDLMFRLDRQSVFLDYKADISDLYAQSEATLIGRRNRDIAPPEFADLIDQKISTTLETGLLQNFEYQLNIPNRGIRDYEARMIPSGSDEVLAVVRDITERKQVENALRTSEEKYRGLMESLDSVVASVDYEGKFLYLNDIAAAQLGSTPEKLIGKTMLELFPEPVAAAQMENVRKVIREDQAHIHEAASFIQGQLRWYRASVQPIHDETGRAVHALINSTDIHDLKTAQQELQELNRTLEERVKERTTDLSRANAELARAARAKDEFLANMSHELRTPLNAILGLSEALLEQVRGPLNERQQASVRNIETSGRHLLALISDILDLSKVEAGRLELLIDIMPVADVCQASLLLVKEAALKKQLQLAFHLNNQLARVQADPKRLKQMLVNLLSNAVKFTPEGGQVSLEVTADAQAGVIRFAVQDSGIGISPEGLARLFQPFTQLDSSLSRQYEGTGLGLALVRRLAELHGGSVTVESDGVPGRGSRFTIALPYQPTQMTNSKPATPEVEPKAIIASLRSALVVEDSESAAEQLTRYLEETNVRTVVHPQGEGALEQAIRLQPGVIFLDLMMPDQSGWEVLAQLKADSRTRDIPVIILSVVDERAKGAAAGAAGYIVKPVSREMLRQTLGVIVAGADSVREALVIVPEVEPVGVRILLAEDNELNIEAFEDYLEDLGYEVVVARNGREALAQAIETQPDLILMDIQMPELDGLQAIRRLRARSEFVTTPIIALTALAMPGDRELCLTAGASEYLTKPIRLKGLVEIIEKLLQQ